MINMVETETTQQEIYPIAKTPPSTASTRLPHHHFPTPRPAQLTLPCLKMGRARNVAAKRMGTMYIYIYIHYHTSYLLISINHRTMKKKFRDWLTVYFPTTYHNMQYSKVQMFRLLAFSWISAWRHDAFTEGTPVMGPSPTTFCQLGVQCATPTKSLLK